MYWWETFTGCASQSLYSRWELRSVDGLGECDGKKQLWSKFPTKLKYCRLGFFLLGGHLGACESIATQNKNQTKESLHLIDLKRKSRLKLRWINALKEEPYCRTANRPLYWEYCRLSPLTRHAPSSGLFSCGAGLPSVTRLQIRKAEYHRRPSDSLDNSEYRID